jgi:acyl-CoA thioesterase FadM
MTSEFAERRDDELLVTGRMVHVFVDPATLIKQRIPDHVRTALAQWTRADGDQSSSSGTVTP